MLAHIITVTDGRTCIICGYVTSDGSGSDSSDSSDTDSGTSSGSVGKDFPTSKGEKHSVSSSEANTLIRDAVEAQSRETVIKPQMSENTVKTEVTIPAYVLSSIGDRSESDVRISTPVADVTISNQVLQEFEGLAADGASVTVTAEREGEIVTIAVTDSDGASASLSSVTVTLPSEEVSAGTVAVLLHADGTREVLRKSVAGEDSLTVTIPVDGSVSLEMMDNSLMYSDVPADSGDAEAVAFASSRQILVGISDTEFNPDGEMTRAMLAQVLHNLESNPDSAMESAFSDLVGSEWYTDAVLWAAENGIVAGYEDGSFGPNNILTQEQLAVMLWNYSGFPTPGSSLLESDVSFYARNAVAWAIENGLMRDIDDLRSSVTRAQTAVLLQRLLELEY